MDAKDQVKLLEGLLKDVRWMRYRLNQYSEQLEAAKRAVETSLKEKTDAENH